MTHRTLPRHARTGLPALGWRSARPGESGDQPIWPILGGAPEDEGDPAETDDGDHGDEQDEDDPEGTEQLGDPGKRALDTMKERLRAERERRRAAEAETAALKAKPAEGDDSAEAIRAQARAEARAEGLRERALDRLEAKAARLFADPEDARAYLGRQVEDFIDGDSVDTDAITEALQELLKRKPYLAATATAAKPKFEGTGDGGARKGSAGPKQLTETDVKKMRPEQIVAAQKAGQLRDYLGG